MRNEELTSGSAGIAGGRRRMIFFAARAEKFGEDGLQRIGPNLITRNRRMKPVGIHHAGKQLPIFACELVIDVQKPNPLAVGKL